MPRVHESTGPQIRVCNWKLFFLFLNQNICCGYSKNHLNETVLLSTQKHMFKLMDKKIIAILRWKYLLNWPYDPYSIADNGFHQYTKPLGALQHLQVYAAEPATLCV